ncbi:hsp70 nucleotide exchange factor FES1 [Drosophila rhopaloa]|uniref:Nucleotide exchange factor Fes1 domain-containing protein n=2 Tax=Drosophila rhopaloa TaxID=1041015 RepID=A0ABM5HHJ9_DRORH|nr:hsp70 nucleotide exchange factor FES1 [Drosophila rhopaloa]
MTDPNVPRGAISYQNVLKYSVQHHDQTGQPKLDEAPDVERHEFLANALNAMTTDASAALKAALVILNSDEASTEDQIESLEAIRTYIDDIDNAISLVKLGGTATLLRYIKDSDSEVRISALNTVAEVAQNNIFCQNALINDKFLPVLTKNLSNANQDIVRSSIYAISSLIRNFQPGYNEFKRIKGIRALIPCLKSTNSNVYIKTAFLIASLTSGDKSVRDDFVKAEVFPVLVENLKPIEEYDVKQETTLFALSSLSLESDLKLSTEKRNDILSSLQLFISKNKQTENCEEMVNYARIIVDNLNAR